MINEFFSPLVGQRQGGFLRPPTTSFWGEFLVSLRSPKNSYGGHILSMNFFPHLWDKDKEDF